jgi:alkyl sulfatase BDS1-like metallo-beta-lactamase superfamily hydrolase
MLTSLKRTLAAAPDQVSDRVAAMIGGAPQNRLEQLMQSPARRLVLGTIFSQMPRRIDTERAAGVHAKVRWCITGRDDGGTDVYQVEVDDGRCRVVRGTTEDEAPVTVTVDGADFLRLATGGSDPMQAYFAGKLSMSGDVMHAATVTSLLRRPGADGAGAS